MKKYHLLLLVCMASLSLHAGPGFGQQWDSMYVYLKKDGHLKTGFFWDLAFPDSSSLQYSGSATDPPVHYAAWIHSYATFLNAAIEPDSVHLPDVSTLNQTFSDVLEQGVIPVPVLDVKGGRVQQSAYTNGSLIFDESLTAWLPMKGAEDLYELHKMFMTAPYMPVVYDRQLKLMFSNNYLYSNSGRTINKLYVSLSGRPAFEAYPGVPLLTVLDEGENTIKVQLLMSDGELLYSEFLMIYDSRDLSGGVPGKDLLTNPFHFGDQYGNIYTNAFRPTEFRKQPGAFIDYLPGYTGGVMHACIQKPLLIVEGIDFGYENKLTGCFGRKCGSMGLIDLELGKLTNPYANKLNGLTEEWDAIKKGPELLHQLRQLGYDVYYIDFHNGADYMENNAMLVKEFIQQLNVRKCTSEEIVVMGASMGGVVARYALTYMEKHKIPHCVRTFLSFDAPHQGANIPLGLQCFMQFYSGKLPSFKGRFKQKIDRPATKQLLIYHCLSQYKSRGHDERNNFMINLKAMGSYPKLCRNIALANGSIDKSMQIFNPGDKLLAMNPYLSGKWPKPVQIWANVFAMATPGQDHQYVVLEAKSYFEDVYYKYLDNDTRFIDHEAGSIRYDLRDARTLTGIINIINLHSSTCFIPTYSSLDLYNNAFNGNISETIPADELAPQYYPFEAYMGVKNTNEEHMKISDENIAWTIRQIEINRNEMDRNLSKVFNFNRTQRRMLGSVNIESQGVLQINGAFMGGYGQSPYDRVSEPGSMLDVYTSDCQPYILVNTGGTLVLGDKNTPSPNKVVLRVRSGSVLRIKDGGVLRIHNGSKLIVEQGAILEYDKGARIVLEGSNAVLQIEGKIILGSKASFSISSGNASNCGYLVLRNPDKKNTAVMIESIGTIASVNLQGKSKNNHLLLQVEGKVAVGNTHDALTVSDFRIGNGIIQYGSMASLSVCGKVKIDTALFELMPRTGGHTSDGILVRKPSGVHITESAFKKLRFAVHIPESDQPYNLIVSNSQFENCVYGIKAKYSKTHISHSVFKGCGFSAARFDAPYDMLLFEHLSFQDNVNGLFVAGTGTQNIPVFVKDCDFIRNVEGINSKKCMLTVRCSRFSVNSTAIVDTLSELNLSSTKAQTAGIFSMYGGKNTFAYNSVSGIQMSASTLHLYNGYNNFIHYSNRSECRFVSGEFAYSSATHESGAPYRFNASGNYWNPLSAGGLQSGSPDMYFVKFPYPGSQGVTENKLFGNVLNAAVTECYTQSSGTADYAVESSGSGDKTNIEPPFNIKMFPFPANGTLTLDIQARTSGIAGTYTVYLYTIDGKQLIKNELDSLKWVVDTECFAEGLYVLEVRSADYSRKEKIYVQH